MSFGYYFTGERDGFLLFSIIFCMWSLFNSDKKTTKQATWLFLSGLFAGTIIFYRIIYSVFILFLVLYLIVFKFKNVKQFLLFGLGIVTPVCIFISAYYYIDGWSALQKFYGSIITSPYQTYTQLFGGRMFSVGVSFRHIDTVKWWLSAGIFFTISSARIYSYRSDKRWLLCAFLKDLTSFCYFRIKEDNIFAFCVLFIFTFLITVFIQGSFQYYHAIPLKFIVFLFFVSCMNNFSLDLLFFRESFLQTNAITF